MNDMLMKTDEGIEVLKRVQHICRAFPEVEEIIDGFGHPVFKVHSKSFVRLGETEESTFLSFKSDKENQEILIQDEKFTITPYIGRHGWVSIESPTDWDELKELITEAYLRAAPKRIVNQLNDTLYVE